VVYNPKTGKAEYCYDKVKGRVRFKEFNKAVGYVLNYFKQGMERAWRVGSENEMLEMWNCYSGTKPILSIKSVKH